MSALLFYVCALAAGLLMRVFVLSIARVKGRSMLPTLQDGDWVFVWRLPYRFRPPRRFDVVICHYPGRRGKRLRFLPQDFVKRVAGLPGDTLEFSDGVLMVNGEKAEEDYLSPALTRFCRPCPPVTLGPGEYYVLGDHRNASNDSRRVGPLRRRAIRGRVVCILWPPRRIRRIR